jgi:hypothetical protein
MKLKMLVSLLSKQPLYIKHMEAPQEYWGPIEESIKISRQQK